MGSCDGAGRVWVGVKRGGRKGRRIDARDSYLCLFPRLSCDLLDEDFKTRVRRGRLASDDDLSVSDRSRLARVFPVETHFCGVRIVGLRARRCDDAADGDYSWKK